MARIGTFKATSDGFVGSIRSLKLSVPKVVFKAIDGDPAKDQPVYRIHADGAEIGAAWKYTSKKGVDFLSVRLDDPSFADAISARLFPAEDGFDLVWSRPARKAEPRPEPDAEPELED